MFDVLVVGFGPAGATLANLLGQRGLDTLVVDKSTAVYELPRAFALDHEIMRTFQNIGIADAVLPHTRPFTASEYYGVDGQLIKRLGSVPPPYPQGWAPNVVFSQPPVERVLRDAATHRPGVHVELGWELIALAQSGDCVTARLRDGAGVERRVAARYLVGCDGAWSTVRESAGLRYEDLGFDEPWLVVDLLVSDEALAKLPDVSIQYCDPARPCTYLIGPGNHRRWEISVLPGEDRRALEDESQVWRLLSRWLKPADATLWRRASYRFHALVAEEWRSGRVFIAGDAAHQQPPFTGQGMCQGIRDVANLAWKLERVSRRGAPDALLDTYGSERRSHVRRLTSVIRNIGALIGERDPVRARARDARLLAEAGGTIVTVPRQELIPPLDTGCLSPLAHPANGTLFPQPLVRAGTQSRRLDDLAGTGVRVVVDSDRVPHDERIAALLDALDATLVRLLPPAHAVADVPQSPSPAVSALLEVVETEGVLAAWFARHDCAAAILRPDHYVYGIARDAAALALQLQRLAQALGLAVAAGPVPEPAHSRTPTSSSNPTPERSTA
jgi:3-(3-hydroxy-phenyl)propionate hydroxylase